MSELKCAQCGIRLRPHLYRCPHCRALVSESLAAAAEPLAARGLASHTGWLALGVAFLVLGAGLVVPSATLPATVTETSTRPQLADLERSTEGAQTASTAAGAMHEALDSMRAGTAAYAQGNLIGALGQYEAAVAATPGDPEARNNLAQVLVRLGRAREALPQLDEAVRIDADQWKYRFNRARVFGQLERWHDAVEEYRVASELFPEDYATQYNLGLALLRVKQYPDAIGALQEAVAAAPGEPSFLITLASAYAGAERADLSRQTLEKFLTLFPQEADAPKVQSLLAAMSEAGQ
jgi:tetratricopeptide (TPR) repeat protein